MRPRLDTAVLLLERPDDRPGGSVLFLVHRAADGWLALDLAGPVTDRFAPPRGSDRPSLEVVRGGGSFPGRVLALYALPADPESFGGLRVPGPGGARFGLGGDVERLLEAALGSPMSGRGGPPRIRFFRGLTSLATRSRAPPAGAIVLRATPELVFEARPGGIGAAELARTSFAGAANEQIGQRAKS